MKVVQINAVCGYGSTGRICAEISEYIKNDIENYIFFGNGKSKHFVARRLNSDLDVRVHGLLSRLFGKQAYFSEAHTNKIIKELQRIQPDIVHLHNLHGNYIHLNNLLDYLAKTDIATVITLHDCWFFTGKCTHYTSDMCYKWKTGCYNCPSLKKDNPSWFFDRTKTMWEDKKKHFEAIPRLAVIGTSQWVTDEAKKSFLSNAKILKRIYNWIDTGVFKPQNIDIRGKYNIPDNKFLILVVSATWNENSKKFKDVIKLSEIIDKNMHILMVGNGAEKYFLPKNITKISYVGDTEELASIYSSSDVYVHVSREDTFGKVIAESLACGTPAIVYNSTGLPELIGDNCGYVVPCEDVDAILSKIRIIKEKGKENYSQACINFAKNNFDKDNLINETIELYKEVLGEKDSDEKDFVFN